MEIDLNAELKESLCLNFQPDLGACAKKDTVLFSKVG